MSSYFTQIISGTQPYEEELASLFEACGLSFEMTASEKTEERDYGIRLISSKDRHVIDDIAFGCVAEKVLSRKDEVLQLNGQDFDGQWPEESEGGVQLLINRFGRSVEVELVKGAGPFFSVYQVTVNKGASTAQKNNLERWLKA